MPQLNSGVGAHPPVGRPAAAVVVSKHIDAYCWSVPDSVIVARRASAIPASASATASRSCSPAEVNEAIIDLLGEI